MPGWPHAGKWLFTCHSGTPRRGRAYLLHLGLPARLPAHDVASRLRSPKIDNRLPTVLSVEQAKHLVEDIEGESITDIRDKAILELLYATAVRVSELGGFRSA